jgi:hypothetical protein
MSYRDHLYGSVAITPPFGHAAVADVLPVRADSLVCWRTEPRTRTVTVDIDGEATEVNATVSFVNGIVPAENNDLRARDLANQLAALARHIPEGREITGRIIRVGEGEPGDVERYRIVTDRGARTVVTDKARLVWPDGTDVGEWWK